MFFQKDIETMPRRELEELQLKKLRHIVDYCKNNVPFYAERLEKAGISGDKITIVISPDCFDASSQIIYHYYGKTLFDIQKSEK